MCAASTSNEPRGVLRDSPQSAQRDPYNQRIRLANADSLDTLLAPTVLLFARLTTTKDRFKSSKTQDLRVLGAPLPAAERVARRPERIARLGPRGRVSLNRSL